MDLANASIYMFGIHTMYRNPDVVPPTAPVLYDFTHLDYKFQGMTCVIF